MNWISLAEPLRAALVNCGIGDVRFNGENRHLARRQQTDALARAVMGAPADNVRDKLARPRRLSGYNEPQRRAHDSVAARKHRSAVVDCLKSAQRCSCMAASSRTG